MPELIDHDSNPVGPSATTKKKVQKQTTDEFNRQLGLSRLRAEMDRVRAFLPRRVFMAVIQEFGEEIEGILKREETRTAPQGSPPRSS